MAVACGKHGDDQRKDQGSWLRRGGNGAGSIRASKKEAFAQILKGPPPFTFKREVLMRMGGSFLFALPFALLPALFESEWIFLATIGLWAGGSEGFVRWSWKKGVVTALLVTFSMYFGYLVAGKPDFFDEEFIVVIMIPTAAYGLAAGVNSGSLLASLLAVPASQASWLLYFGILLVLDKIFRDETVWTIALNILSTNFALPPLVGLAVWLGVKYSKRGQPNPPGNHAPSSV